MITNKMKKEPLYILFDRTDPQAYVTTNRKLVEAINYENEYDLMELPKEKYRQIRRKMRKETIEKKSQANGLFRYFMNPDQRERLLWELWGLG